MNKPRIAVSMRVTHAADYGEPRDAVSHDWIRFIDEQNCLPMLIPNALVDVEGFLEACDAAAVILTGGNDVCDESADSGGESASALRDAQERRILDYCGRTRLPVLAVCRGLHFLNAYGGGGIERRLDRVDLTVNHVGQPHAVRLEHPELARLAGSDMIDVNSYHRHGVLRNQVAPTLEIMAVAGTVVEGLLHKSLPQLAIQWHPERSGASTQLDRRLFQSMLGAFEELRCAASR